MSYQLNREQIRLLFVVEDHSSEGYSWTIRENADIIILNKQNLVRGDSSRKVVLTKRGDDLLNIIYCIRKHLSKDPKPKQIAFQGIASTLSAGHVNPWQNDPATAKQKGYINALAEAHPALYEEATKILSLSSPGWEWGSLTKGQAGILIQHMKENK